MASLIRLRVATTGAGRALPTARAARSVVSASLPPLPSAPPGRAIAATSTAVWAMKWAPRSGSPTTESASCRREAHRAPSPSGLKSCPSASRCAGADTSP